MRRNVLARSVRSLLVERLENRLLLSSTLSLGTGTGQITGLAYNDVNSDGVYDAGDLVVPGATITLQQVGVTYAPGTVPTVQADVNGAFSFTGLAAGEYNVNIVPDTGFAQDAPGTLVVTVSANDTAQIIVGETNTGTGGSGFTNISGTVFNDLNGSGVYAPGQDEFLAGDTVYLDLNGNGVPDPTEPSTITNNLGFYTFQVPSVDMFGNPTMSDTLAPGSYEVRVVPRPGFHQDPPGYVQATAYSDQPVTANIGESNFATISGVVFQDLNGNGVQDPGELGVSGETVFVDSNLDGLLEAGTFNPSTGQFDNGEAWTTTNTNGLYALSGLTPGNYRIIEQSNAIPIPLVEDKPQYTDVTLTAGENFTLNIGEGLPTTISGTVFNDRNGNGVLDPGENGMPNQIVYLDVNSNGAFDPTGGTGPDGMPAAYPEPSATTDANGNYTIFDVGPGTYTLRVVTPTGAIPTAPANTTHSYTLTILPDQTLANENFGSESPDLTIKFIKFSTSPALTDVTRRTVVRVTNVGNLPFNGSVSVDLWAQLTNAAVDTTTADLVATLPAVPERLGVGQSRLIKYSFVYPTQLSLNAYYISAQVIASSADNNPTNDFTAPTGPAQIGPPYVDIGLAYATLPPFTIDPGQPIPIELVVTNHGNVPTKGDLDFRIYSSAQGAIDPNDVVLQDTILPRFKLQPNQSRVVQIIIPYTGTDIGFRFINVIVSTNDPLGDGNQANNTAIEAQPTRFD